MQYLGQNPSEITELTTILLERFALAAGEGFGRHTHPEHQLSWAPSGVLTVDIGSRSWALPPTRALWVPAGVEHDVSAHSDTVLHNLYFLPWRCPIDWVEPTLVEVSSLLRSLVLNLAADLPEPQRHRSEAVTFDQFRRTTSTEIEVPLPIDDRALAVARAILGRPDDDSTLDAWGRTVGASSRTLTRLFVGETGLTFHEWRTRARLRAAVAELAAGAPVGSVARRVGYRDASSFIAMFQRRMGQTPAAYSEAITALAS